MLRRIVHIAFLLSWATIWISSASSSRPPVAQSPIKGAEHQNAADGAYEDQGSPLVFAVIAIRDILHNNRDDISAASTLVIAVFTIILGLFTISLARSTRKAANSAVEASGALLATERGTIVETIRHVHPGNALWAHTFDNSPTMPASECDVVISLYFTNYGKTPATLYDIGLNAVISDKLPEVEPLINEPYVLVKPTLAQNERTVEIDLARTFVVSWRVSRDLIAGLRAIYVTGTIMYIDVFSTTWRRTFIWEYIPSVRACRLRYEKTDREIASSPMRRPDPPPRGVPKMGKIFPTDPEERPS